MLVLHGLRRELCHIWYLGSFSSMFKMLFPEMFMTWCNMGFLTKKLTFFRFSLAGSATEMRVASPYIPTDERFDHVKLSDNKADMVRAAGHAISSKIQAKLSKKTSFESIEEVKKLYAPKGKFDGGINNVLPTKADVSTRDQQPLVFLKELTAKRNDGEKNNILLFPIPQIIQGKLILDKERDFLDLMLELHY